MVFLDIAYYKQYMMASVPVIATLKKKIQWLWIVLSAILNHQVCITIISARNRKK